MFSQIEKAYIHSTFVLKTILCNACTDAKKALGI